MNIVANFEHGASSSRGKHEGESSFALCDRLSRTRDNSQRQLPTDHDYAVPTREYQTDQSSLNLPRLLLALSSRNNYNDKNTHRFAEVDTVTPYQGKGRDAPEEAQGRARQEDKFPGRNSLAPWKRSLLDCDALSHSKALRQSRQFRKQLDCTQLCDAWDADQQLISLMKQFILPNERHRFAT